MLWTFMYLFFGGMFFTWLEWQSSHCGVCTASKPDQPTKCSYIIQDGQRVEWGEGESLVCVGHLLYTLVLTAVRAIRRKHSSFITFIQFYCSVLHSRTVSFKISEVSHPIMPFSCPSSSSIKTVSLAYFPVFLTQPEGIAVKALLIGRPAQRQRLGLVGQSRRRRR